MAYRVVGPSPGDTQELRMLLQTHLTLMNHMSELTVTMESQFLLGDLVRIAQEWPEGMRYAQHAVLQVIEEAKAAGHMELDFKEKKEAKRIAAEQPCEVIEIAPGD